MGRSTQLLAGGRNREPGRAPRATTSTSPAIKSSPTSSDPPRTARTASRQPRQPAARRRRATRTLPASAGHQPAQRHGRRRRSDPATSALVAGVVAAALPGDDHHRSATHPSQRWLRITVVEHEDLLGRSIAVIGSGVAGLTAAYVLSAPRPGDAVRGRHPARRSRPHPLRRPAATAASSASTRRSWCTTTAPTRRCADCSTNSASPPRTPTCRCRCATTTIGLEYAGRRGIGGLFPSLANLARPRYLRMLAEITRFHRAATRLLRDERSRRPTRTARRVPRPARLLPLLRRALHDAAGRRGVVVRARATRCATPRATCSSSSTTTACCRCSARRHGAPSSAVRRPTSRRSPPGSRSRAPARRCTRVRRVPDGVLVTAGDAAAAAVRRGRHRHPPRPGAAACSPSRPPPNARCSARFRTRPTTPSCTPTNRCCRDTAGPRVVELSGRHPSRR